MVRETSFQSAFYHSRRYRAAERESCNLVTFLQLPLEKSTIFTLQRKNISTPPTENIKHLINLKVFYL